MKALVLEDFGRLAVHEIPRPAPGPGDVLIEIVATGICGSDIHGYTGENGRRAPGQVMGHESVGRIAALGSHVTDAGLRVGGVATFNPVVVPRAERAAFKGREQHSPGKHVIGVKPDVVAAFAQYVCVPAENVVPLSDEMPILYGALVEPLAVALHACRRVGVDAGQRVLVIGGGPIGQSVVLALLMIGVQSVVVSEVSAERRALVESLGARTIDPTAGSVPDQSARVLGGEADVTIDAVGITVTLRDALLATRLGGSVCLVGMGAPTVELDAFRVSTEERTLVGSFTYSDQDFADAAAWIATSPPAASYLISREVALDEADAAFASLARSDGTPGKVLVRVDTLSGGQAE